MGNGRPAGRASSAIAFQPTTGRAVLFGGSSQSGQDLGDTFEFDGHGWIHRTPTTSPSPRRGHSMAFDPATKRVVLWGGQTAIGNSLTDTWAWDGLNWTQIPVASPPAAATWSAMTHHGGTNPGLLLVTMDATGTSRTYLWTGSSWSPQNLGGGPFTGGFALAHVPMNGHTYLQGGSGGELYNWNGSQWSLVTQMGTPGNLTGQSLVWSHNTSKLMVVGGTTP
ncbi:MAG: hypothetical protein JNK15_09885, partial [Planctomycetes bacterium]|nr:hypothetical protein [Planctomycetota bacterium]